MIYMLVMGFGALLADGLVLLVCLPFIERRP